jgi:Ca2+/Na+ antiporter
VNTSLDTLLKSPIQIIVLIWFITFIIFPIQIPNDVAKIFDSPLGVILLFMVGVFCFSYAHPIVTIIFVIYAYEVIRRSTKNTHVTNGLLEFTPTDNKRDKYMNSMNPPKERSLEEDMVAKMAPIGENRSGTYVDSSFKPVADEVHNAFVY